MSTITREWLQQAINDYESVRDELPFGLDDYQGNILAALRIALASLEAEPIGFRCRRNDNLGDWSYVYHREPDDFERKHLVIEGIYAAPPAPVSVPAAMEMDDDFDSAFEHGKAVGWNAYRAAMLQSFGNSEQLNSPVIPDGWVMVPVEPTMAMLDEFDSIIDYGAEDSKDAWSRLIAAALQR